jgi:hypothetical protein
MMPSIEFKSMILFEIMEKLEDDRLMPLSVFDLALLLEIVLLVEVER